MPFWRDQNRDYLRCLHCQLVSVPPRFHVDEQAERAEYDRHRNDPADPAYRRFLSRLANPLLDRLAPASSGLDFGCGPGPTLSKIFVEAGHSAAVYDKFYATNKKVLQRQYDFASATEVVEHLAEPRQALESLWALLVRGGWLGIMTKLVIDQPRFSQLHYKNDPTHISYFSRQTFIWLADFLGADLEFVSDDAILLRKRGSTRRAWVLTED